MSLSPAASVAFVRGAEAEELVSAGSVQRLLVDSAQTGGALSAHRILLRDGAEGANPHRHLRSSELFYVLSGAVDVLARDEVLRAAEGDLVVVPPGTDHAFAAAPRADAELLVLITPGVDRFELFRDVHRVMTGAADPAVLRAREPEWFDNHPARGTAWATRATG